MMCPLSPNVIPQARCAIRDLPCARQSQIPAQGLDDGAVFDEGLS
jgi:hypothetical protein